MQARLADAIAPRALASAKPRSPPPERAIVTPAEMSLMKLLFSIKHLLSSKKPLKSYAWYIWY
ncbi:hypothetical protein SB85_18115 [Xanthomonas sacchari]|nr:hypothetical protein SB85_18115 [Xanthomonas sacchari]MCW0462929.1 hypothetical protein [Xanthomonas sacchari]TYD35422.1 hypothetical protein CEK63_08540 [Xanthomonas sontii]